jgi:hypothetical protein
MSWKGDEDQTKRMGERKRRKEQIFDFPRKIVGRRNLHVDICTGETDGGVEEERVQSGRKGRRGKRGGDEKRNEGMPG